MKMTNQCKQKLRIPVTFQDYEYEEDPNAIEGLPASAADLLDKPYDDGFNCDQQDAGYGYYADTLNDCKVKKHFFCENPDFKVHWQLQMCDLNI